jgi:hypothetical protein
MSFCRVFFTFNKYSEFQASLVICIHEIVGLWRMVFEQSLWKRLEQFVFCYIAFVVPLSLCHKSHFRYVTKFEKNHDLGKKKSRIG